MQINRRNTLKGAAAVATTAICEPVYAAVKSPSLPCGCSKLHLEYEGEDCTVHDEAGKRWDAYTGDEIAKAMNYGGYEIQTADTEWSCYCGRHDDQGDNLMPIGTRCLWFKTSYEYDEWECQCEASIKDDWLRDTTIDWYAASKEI